MVDYSGQLAEIIKALSQIKTDLSQNSSSQISSISAIASFIAALASLWAASSAYRAMRNVQRIARLGILRNLIQVGYDIISEAEQVESLVVEIRTQIRDIATFTGTGSGPMVGKIIGEAELKHKRIVPLLEEAQKLIAEGAALKDKSEQELSQKLSQFDGHLSRVRRVRYQLEKQAEADATQLRIHQTDAIMKRP